MPGSVVSIPARGGVEPVGPAMATKTGRAPRRSSATGCVHFKLPQPAGPGRSRRTSARRKPRGGRARYTDRRGLHVHLGCPSPQGATFPLGVTADPQGRQTPDRLRGEVRGIAPRTARGVLCSSSDLITLQYLRHIETVAVCQI
jgi:hypothetical protein